MAAARLPRVFGHRGITAQAFDPCCSQLGCSGLGCHMHAPTPTLQGSPAQQMSIIWPAVAARPAASDTGLCMVVQLQKPRLAARRARSGAGPAQAPQQFSPATLAPATCCPEQEGSATADIPVPAPKGVNAGKKGKGKAALLKEKFKVRGGI